MIPEDDLFAAMTRPPTLFGVPAYATGIYMMAPILLVMTTQHVYFAILIPFLYVAVRAICIKDPRQMEYLVIAFKTKMRGARNNYLGGNNRKLWGASSYAPYRLRKR